MIVSYRDGRGKWRKKTVPLSAATEISVKVHYIVEEEREFDTPIEFEDGRIADFFEAIDADGKTKVPQHLHESFETCAVCQKLKGEK